jgi:hypothetical protein
MDNYKARLIKENDKLRETLAMAKFTMVRCKAFIVTNPGEGWEQVLEHLQDALQDIETCKVDGRLTGVER